MSLLLLLKCAFNYSLEQFWDNITGKQLYENKEDVEDEVAIGSYWWVLKRAK